MTEEKQVKTTHGLGAKFKVGDSEREIVGYLCTDGGVYWKFLADGREYPLKLSKEGMDVMIQIWHELMWGRDPVTLQHSE